MALAALYGVLRGVDVFSAMADGARDGLRVVVSIFPPLWACSPPCTCFAPAGPWTRSRSCSPPARRTGNPAETAPLMFLRPISGSGALAVGSELIELYGADSLVGRTAAVMLGSTETTFYVIAVYFGAAGIRRTRYAVPAALCADLTGFLVSALTVRWLWFGI